MKEILEWIIHTWEMYWGSGFYQYLLLAAALYLLIFHRKKQSVRQTLAFSFAVLFVFLCPLTARIIRACIGQSVYWRVLWLLPAIPVIAMAAVEFLRGRKSRPVQLLLVLVCCGAIALSGQDMLRAGSYVRTANRQKVPDDIANICNLVLDEAARDEVTEIRMAADDYVASYARVYDASILQPYGRWGMGALIRQNSRIYNLMHQPEPRNYRKIAKLCQKTGCNFLVISVPEKRKRKIRRYGYTEIGTVGSYTIFQLEDS